MRFFAPLNYTSKKFNLRPLVFNLIVLISFARNEIDTFDIEMKIFILILLFVVAVMTLRYINLRKR